ncbi:uncharacterized protein LOC114271117 [Camellia sinensis]|uniref:uncharacterized protein LOC114271117 n=1 Tax=Camellia sinensis TaxID=4442 RepID=UPI0010356FD1|nr:uncharacterized protein LOC114271117 [Camellia sinensis]
MEALSKLLARAGHEGFLEGFVVESPTGASMSVSRLLHADNVLIFCGAVVEQLGYLKCALLCFKAISGLRGNLRKSKLIPEGKVEGLPVLAAVLGSKVSILLVTYLGLPLGASFKAKGVWDGVVEWIQRQLASWQRQYLSKEERLNLIKSVLSSIPTYFMFVYVISVSVARRIEKLQKDFLWGSGGDDFSYHLVDWGWICQPKVAGGEEFSDF